MSVLFDANPLFQYHSFCRGVFHLVEFPNSPGNGSYA